MINYNLALVSKQATLQDYFPRILYKHALQAVTTGHGTTFLFYEVTQLMRFKCLDLTLLDGVCYGLATLDGVVGV